MNTKFKKAIEELGEGQMAVLTEEGEKLIGLIGNPKVLALFNPQIALLPDEEGIWLKREKKITFLWDHNIKSIRKAKPSEKEIDHSFA